MNDDFLTNILPVRHGEAQGRSAENRMLRAIGGAGGFRTRLQNNPDGSVTMLRTRGGMPEFTTLKTVVSAQDEVALQFGMSSGAYELGSVSPGDAVSATNYKSGDVLVNENLAFKSPLQVLIAKPTLASGSPSNYYNPTKKPGGSLNTAKTSIYQHRPSSFSGLMRRMVQGQYGSGYADCKSGPFPIYNGGEEDQRISLVNTSAVTTGIIKYEQSYIMVKISLGDGVLNVKAYPLEFPEGLRYADLAALMAEFPTTSNEFKAIETLALANARTDLTKELDLGSQSAPLGTSVAYGWSFSETTNTASIVIRTPLGLSGDRNQWAHLTMTFPSSGLLAYTCTTTELKNGWMLASKSPIWVSSDADTAATNALEAILYPDSDQDFPVYAYHIKDEIKVVRWKWSGEERVFDLEAWLAEREASIWGNAIFGDGYAEGEAKQEFGVVAAHGFYIQSSGVLSQATERRIEINKANSSVVSEPTAGTYGLGPVTSTQIIASLPNYTVYNPYISPTGLTYTTTYPDPHPGEHHYWLSYKTSTVTRESERLEGGGTGSTHVSALIIPYGECSACYIGTQQVEQGIFTIDNYVSNAYRSGATEWQMINVGTEAVPLWVTGGTWASVELQLAADGPHGMTGDFEYISHTTTTEDRAKTTTVINFYGASTHTVGNVDADFFHATPMTPLLGYRVVSLSSSLFGDSLYSTGTLSDAEAVASEGYPNTIDAFIGAS